MAVFVNPVSLRKLIEGETHVTPNPLRKMGEANGVGNDRQPLVAKLKSWPAKLGTGHPCVTIDDNERSRHGNQTRALT